MTQQEINRFVRAKRALFDKHYSFLNSKQREAVYSVNGPLLILAGAGSGKTTVLVNRIAHIIKYGDAYYTEYVPEFMTEDTLSDLEDAINLPGEQIEKYLELFAKNPCPTWGILAITFTNKAANEIKERLEKILKEDASEIWAGTFHSICMRILRRNGELVGYRPGFSVCDADDAKKLISASIKELGINEKILSVKDIQNIISRAKDKLMTPDDYRADAGNDYKYKLVADVYEKYQKNLESSNVLDFDDIIMKTVFLLRQNPDVLMQYQNKFRYVCIDEYQDTNEAQFALVKLLSDFYRNIMVVGDDDQSIYKFRGATIENILNFDSTYTEAKVVKLEQNYRSTSNILNAANGLISKNYHKHKKELWCANEQGEKIVVKETPSQNDEARFIVDEIIRLKEKNGYNYKDFAVLYRMNALSRSLETIFANSGIPYRMLGAHRFYDREEIKDMIAYLSVINNPDDSVHLRRIYNKPARRIGDTSYERASTIATELGVSVLTVMKNAFSYNAIPKTAMLPMAELANMIYSFKEELESTPLDTLLEMVIKRTGYEKMLIEEGESGKERRENLEQLITAIKEYEAENEDASLTGFLEQIALVADVDKYDENDDTVILMTIHSAKGLEFPIVFIPGMEECIFPSQQTIMFPSEIEEERRLAYVAITRAKKALYMVHAKERMMHGMTMHNPLSRFVKEIDPSFLDIQKVALSRGSFTMPQSKGTISFTEALTGSKNAEKKPLVHYGIGDRVNHASFGDGTVVGVTPMSNDFMYEIMFDTVGTKKLMATYTQRLMHKI